MWPRRVWTRCAAAAAAAGSLTLGARGHLEAASAPGAPPARPTFDPCPEVACKSKEELAAMFAADPPPRRRGARTSAVTPTPTPTPTPLPPACPASREELGRQTWTFLHSVAAYYPDAPSAAQEAAAAGLVAALVELYPCVHCRARLVVDVAANPPRLGSRAAFSAWLCEQHNVVNELTGRPRFDCALGALDERWRVGAPACWAPTASGGGARETAEESLGADALDSTPSAAAATRP